MYFRMKHMMLMLSASLCFCGPARAGLLNTDTAEPVAPQHVEIEFNGSYTADSSTDNGVKTKTRSTDGDISITAGVVKGVDIAVSLPYTFSSREKVAGQLTASTDGWNDMTVDLKLQVYENGAFKFAVKPGIILPTGSSSAGLSDGKFGFSTALIASGEFYEGKLALHANADYGRHNFKDDAVRDTTKPEFFAFSLACEAETAEGTIIAAEAGFATNSDKADNTPHAYSTVGVRRELSPLLEWYAGIRAGLTSPEADVAALFGIVLKF